MIWCFAKSNFAGSYIYNQQIVSKMRTMMGRRRFVRLVFIIGVYVTLTGLMALLGPSASQHHAAVQPMHTYNNVHAGQYHIPPTYYASN